SCLADALESGTGRAAFTQFGLRKIPAAGKTGTAYDFTDALFAGYDSNFTCAVWTGFDKPQRIYRGAFGRELALPVWVDIMNAAAERYPPREIKQPAFASGGLKQVEICSKSGLLATDKCYDAVKTANGDTLQRRTTYMEIGTQAQLPTEPCTVHGEPRARLARFFSSSDLPRAALAVDLSGISPVTVKSPTLLADKDPYSSLKPTLKPEPAPQPPDQTVASQKPDSVPGTSAVRAANVDGGGAGTQTESAPEIRKAIPIQPQDQKPVEIRRAIPVKPLDQEEQDQRLLKSATPGPGDIDE